MNDELERVLKFEAFWRSKLTHIDKDLWFEAYIKSVENAKAGMPCEEAIEPLMRLIDEL